MYQTCLLISIFWLSLLGMINGCIALGIAWQYDENLDFKAYWKRTVETTAFYDFLSTSIIIASILTGIICLMILCQFILSGMIFPWLLGLWNSIPRITTNPFGILLAGALNGLAASILIYSNIKTDWLVLCNDAHCTIYILGTFAALLVGICCFADIIYIYIPWNIIIQAILNIIPCVKLV